MIGAEHDGDQKTQVEYLDELKKALLGDGHEDDDHMPTMLSLIDDEARWVVGAMRQGFPPTPTDPETLHKHLIDQHPDNYILGRFGPHVATLALQYYEAGIPEQQ